MAFARTWAEELIAEWMQQKDYLVETGIPVPIPNGKGGRREADVVGARLGEDGLLEILHVETGALLDEPTVKRVGQKFSVDVRRYIISRFKNRFGGWHNRVKHYTMRCIVTYPHGRVANWKHWVAAIHRLNPHIKVSRLDDFIKQDVLSVLPKDREPMLPEGQWLLCLTAYLRSYSVCNFGNLAGQKPDNIRKSRKLGVAQIPA
jgi:hypothetical protein